MINRIATLAVFAFAVGCAGDEGKDSGDSGPMDSDTDMTTDCPTFYTGPVLVDLAQVTCNSVDEVRYFVETAGWTSGGLFFSQETGNADTPFDQWSDEHDILSYEFDACGNWDRLEQVLSTGVDYTAWAVNNSTVFSCQPAEHFDGSNVMSYAARVYDLDGNFADCLAWGDDVTGMIGGAYNRANEPAAPTELNDCEEGIPTR